jgi:membrane protein DedA with SNARE-associated domain
MNHALLLIEQYKYLVLFPLAAIEGPVVSLVVGFLIRLGYISLIPSFIILILGDLLPDSIYYAIGRFGNRSNVIQKYGNRSGLVSNNFTLAEKLWRHHGKKTMFFSKLAYGLSTIFLISAGLVRMPFKKFVAYAVPVTIFQYGIILAAGYFLGHSYESALKYVNFGGYLVADIVVVLIIGYIVALKYARGKIEKMEFDEEQAQ